MKKRLMVVGTPYFESYGAVVRYYGKERADYKLENKEVYVGRPDVKENERLLIDKKERRYKIEIFKSEV